MKKDPKKFGPRFNGFIPLLRNFQKHSFWTESREYSRAEAWIDLLFMARYGAEEEQKWDRGELIKIQYSQILTSLISLAEKWHRSRWWVKHFIGYLEKDQSIYIISMNKRRTILQVVNMGKTREYIHSSEQQIAEQTLQHKISKTTHKNKDDKNKKEIIKTGSTTNQLIALFSGVNPSYKLLYSNITERKSLERLISQYGEEKMQNLISSLPSIVQRPYAPRITTPYELELKIGKLLLFLKQDAVLNEKGGVTKV